MKRGIYKNARSGVFCGKLFPIYFFAIFFTIALSLDFFRAAVFFLIVFFWAALSILFTAILSHFWDSSTFPCVAYSRVFFVAFRNTPLTRLFFAVFRFVTRIYFFAALMIGIERIEKL